MLESEVCTQSDDARCSGDYVLEDVLDLCDPASLQEPQDAELDSVEDLAEAQLARPFSRWA